MSIPLACVHVYVTKRSLTRKEREKALACAVDCLCVCVCVCVRARVCEGHSTVPYIKLSAPQLSSSSKWSRVA